MKVWLCTIWSGISVLETTFYYIVSVPVLNFFFLNLKFFLFPSANNPACPLPVLCKSGGDHKHPLSVPHDQQLCQWRFMLKYTVTCCLSISAWLKLYRLKGRKQASEESCRHLGRERKEFCNRNLQRKEGAASKQIIFLLWWLIWTNLHHLQQTLPLFTFFTQYYPSAATVV